MHLRQKMNLEIKVAEAEVIALKEMKKIKKVKIR